MVKVSGFTIVRNAVKLDFPLEASIRSILPICDEVVVNVGRSDDETLDLVRSIGDPKVRVLETEWDMSLQDTVLRLETQRAMRACRHPWGVYIQADEVLHERGRGASAAGDRSARRRSAVEGLLVDYLHFYGGFDTIATHRRWYRREVRAVRLDPALGHPPVPGRAGLPGGTGAPEDPRAAHRRQMFHYGWARPARALREKRELGKPLYPWRRCDRAAAAAPDWIPGIRRFGGTHPAPRPAGWMPPAGIDPERVIAPRRFRWRFLRYYVSGAIERLTGIRPFEFRNYTLV